MVEVDWVFQSDNGKTELLMRLNAWWNHYARALHGMNKDARVGGRLGSLMRQAGFQSIKSEPLEVPAAGWKDGMSR